MNKVSKDSMDLIKENIKDLEKLFPEAVKEGEVDFDVLKELLSNTEEAESTEKYEFTWPGKQNSLRISQTGTRGTLRPDKESSKNWNTTENLYIEGDNLEVLKILQRSYYGKVDVIYIDPPYNTGNEFVYKDDYKDNLDNYLELTDQVDEAGNKYSPNTNNDGRFHSNWLNMMYPRLKLARNLLTDDGCILISIDDNELSNSIKICDEVFGESNKVAVLIWKSKSGGANDSSAIAIDTEYILVYAKNIGLIDLNGDDEAEVTTSYSHSDEKGYYSLERLDKQNLGYSESLDFSIKGSDGKIYKVIHKDEVKRARWRWSKQSVEERYEELVFKYPYVYTKNYQKASSVPRNLLIEDRFGRTRTGNNDIKKLFNNQVIFSFPKNIKLIRYLLKIFTNTDSIVLDFFSGSSTTAHAVMDLNAEDGGKRKFIMVQLPEETGEKSEAYKAGYKTISEIGKERIRRAGKKIKEDNKDKEGIEDLDIGFKAFKLDSTNIKEWDPSFMENGKNLLDLVDNFIDGRSNEDVLYEIMLKTGIEPTAPVEEHKFEEKAIYNIGFGVLFVVLDSGIEESIFDEIIKLSKEYNMPSPVAVFKDKSFKNDTAKSNIELNLKSAGFTEIMSI